MLFHYIVSWCCSTVFGIIPLFLAVIQHILVLFHTFLQLFHTFLVLFHTFLVLFHTFLVLFHTFLVLFHTFWCYSTLFLVASSWVASFWNRPFYLSIGLSIGFSTYPVPSTHSFNVKSCIYIVARF